MSFDLTGIENVNEFYSHHYLNAILEDDLKDLFKNWKEEEEKKDKKAPYSVISAMSGLYFKRKDDFLKAKNQEEKIEILREFYAELMYQLGYELKPDIKELEEQEVIPISGEVKKNNGKTDIWLIEAVADEDSDPFRATILEKQLNGKLDPAKKIPQEDWEEIISKKILTLDEPPRWIIFINIDSIFLLDRSKWGQKKWLRFDLSDIFGRKELSTIKAFSALLHRDNISPSEGICFLDTLDENSHKHAFSVSEDLKFGIRKAVELIGNEFIHYNREKLHEKMYDKDLAKSLTTESLRFLYRLLFIFYIEARPELEFAPMKSEEYRKGYSLESLRDLELVPLNTEEARNGYYIDTSLKKLFELIYNGFGKGSRQLGLWDNPGAEYKTFSFYPLKSHLFDPASMTLLNKIKFRNSVLQEIIRLLSLSKEEKRKTRGRISYAQLGINQLGAVYEGLLSYTGFFAEEDLYQAAEEGKDPDDIKEQAYFVTETELHKYEEHEKVYEKDGSLRCYRKGTFIYRLAGRDREKSASYYTPEVLTRCVVKYSLKELLKDKSADDILNITVCEPALGSGSFLNETLNQLSEAYLSLKQKETGEMIEHDRYSLEKQKVKAFIGANNIYGVDLNEIAVELAEVSIWLNTIYPDEPVPWLRMNFATGNSLVGAGRNFFEAHDIKNTEWLSKVPEHVELSGERGEDKIYHFLLPDKDMANYKGDKVIGKLVPEKLKIIDDWKREFIKSFSKRDIEILKTLSNSIDKLWMSHGEARKRIRERTGDKYILWGMDSKEEKKPDRLNVQQKDNLKKELDYPFSPYKRLKLVMDYWCSLWFWPVDKAELLPTKDEFLMDLQMILTGSLVDLLWKTGQIDMFEERKEEPENKDLLNRFGFVNTDEVCEKVPRLQVVRETGERIRFFHWELEFADLFFDKGGFDLIVGNPPWVKVEWNEGGLLSDYDPLISLRKLSASDVAKTRENYLGYEAIKSSYLNEFEEFTGLKSFINGIQNYPYLKGVQSNLYKCFITKSWIIGNNKGISAFLHPDGTYDDPQGSILRKEINQRVKYHFQFINELNLFVDIHHNNKYSINIYSIKPSLENISYHIFNLFHPNTVKECFDHNGLGEVEGIKDKHNKWNLKGHRNRIIEINNERLKLLATLYDNRGMEYLGARLPSIHVKQIINVIRKFADCPSKLSNNIYSFYTTEMWHETNAQKELIIKKQFCQPFEPVNWIVSGPHFFIATPFNKTPNENCKHNQDYSTIDLSFIDEDFLPFTNYIPAVFEEDYINLCPVPFSDNTTVLDYYRLCFRKMIGATNERTLIGAILPKGCGHIHGIKSYTFENNKLLAIFSSYCFSIIYDFLIKSIGKPNLPDIHNILPLIENSKYNPYLINRTLRLNCLTTHYAELWQELHTPEITKDSFSKSDPRLKPWNNLTTEWSYHCALRTPYERRQALVEIDALSALSLGLTIEELLTIYRIQFPVLQKYEKENHYDQKGLLIPNEVLKIAQKEGIDITKAGSSIKYTDQKLYPLMEREYITPFDTCDREADMRQAYEYFKSLVVSSQ